MAYLKVSGELSANSINFSTNQFMYEIDFVKMKQKNLDPTYGTEREISRRPALSRFEFKFFIDVLETMFKTNFRFKYW